MKRDFNVQGHGPSLLALSILALTESKLNPHISASIVLHSVSEQFETVKVISLSLFTDTLCEITGRLYPSCFSSAILL